MKRKPRYQPGDVIGDHYLVKDFTRGGMGEVYFCRDQKKEKRDVAIKILQDKLLSRPTVIQSFLQEGATWIRLGKHPHIVQAFYCCKDHNDYPYIVIECVMGDTQLGVDLRRWLRYGPREISESLTFAIHIAQGMIHVQKIFPGMAHGDLKPENLLITQQKHMKITDFGLVNVVADGNVDKPNSKSPDIIGYSQPGLLIERGGVGTPPYMAPELWNGESSTTASDIYAFGCILYEMLTGTALFKGITLGEFKQVHSQQEPIIQDLFPGGIRKTIRKCVNKEPGERFDSWTRLLEELRNVYTGIFGEEPFLSNDNLASSKDWEAWYRQADSLSNLHRYEEALHYVQQSLELNPDSAGAWLLQGEILAYQGKFKSALPSFENAHNLGASKAQQYIEEMKQRLGMFVGIERPTIFDKLDGEIAEMWIDMKASGLHRERSMYSLGNVEVPPDKKASFDKIVKAISDNDENGIDRAVESFKSLPDEEKEMVMKIAFDFLRVSYIYYDDFASNFARLGEPIIKYLLLALEDRHWSVRYTAAQALTHFDEPIAIQHFLKWFFSDLEWELHDDGFEIAEELAEKIVRFAVGIGDKLLIERIKNYYGPTETLEDVLRKYGE